LAVGVSALHDLARDAGLHVDWEDAMGEHQRVGDDALAAVLHALGFDAGGDAAIADSRARIAEEQADCHFLSGDVGCSLRLPLACGGPRGELALADGTRRDIAIARVGEDWLLPAIDVPGYHRLIVGNRTIRLAVAPSRCFGVGDAAPGRRLWGPAVQIAGLRDDRDTAFGDFATLADSAAAFAKAGADALAISPVHALFPADPGRYSPYAPSSRLFLNVLYADPGLVGISVPPGNADALIDWQTAIPIRMALLRVAFDTHREMLRDTIANFAAERGEELRRHALFDALHAHFFALNGASGWQGWPGAFHDPAGEAAQRFAAEHRDTVDFYIFLQWLAKQSLDAAQRAATNGGMALGLIADLAVGMDPGGSHGWSRRDELLSGLSIGAPPDIFAPEGQDWGITGFSPFALRRTGFDPFVATLRAAIDHAGGLRIDHALGLQRLWVVPHGASAAEGAYLSMPIDDCLRVLAIESVRARAVVIGEDLGTVPEGFRPKMDRRGMLGMRVLPFEREEDGMIVPPDRWSGDAAAMTGTHDLPTVAGYWRGRDIDWTWTLGRPSRAANEAADRAARADDRTLWWDSFVAAGAATGPEPAPDEEAPVVDAAVGFVAATPSALAILPIEDVAGLVEQPNLPGTIDEHPNWRRRLPETTEALLASHPVAARIDRINTARQ
jgi:4-alpha-glucanotransferase